MNFIKKHYPLILSVIYILILVLLVFFKSYNKNDGNLVYVVDDAYIHMSIAKNIVENQIIGVTKHEFSSSTSSPLWTTLITSGYLLFGVNNYLPFVFNILSSLLLIYIIYFIFKSYDLSNLAITILLFFIITITPFTLHIFTGMEHLLQTSLIIGFIFLSATLLVSDKVETKLKIFFLVITILTTSVRYESLFLLFIVFVLLLLRRKFLFSILFLIVGLLPIILYGYVSVSNGQYFFPNSVLINENIPESLSLGGLYKYIVMICRGITDFEYKTMILVIIGLILIYLIKEKIIWEKHMVLLIIYFSYYICLTLFSNIIYFRHTISIFITGVVIVGVCFLDLNRRFMMIDKKFLTKSKKIIFIPVCVILLIFLVILNISLLGKSLIATNNVYQQQFQMSVFLKKYYNESSVAANDVGLITFNSDIKLTDLVGIGSIKVINARRNNNYDKKLINILAKENKIKIAILYESWFSNIGGLPNDWNKVGEWRLRNNIICGDDVVSFFVVAPEEQSNLIKNLKDFSSELPKAVIQSGRYVNGIE